MKLARRTLVLASIGVWVASMVAGAWAPAAAAPASSSDPSGEAMPGQIPGWTQTFADDFTSPSTLSNYQVQNSSGPAPDGSGSCVASNHVGVTGGMLVIRGYKDPAGAVSHGCTDDANQWVTGGVKLTANSQTYGKYEVRMRVDNGQGVSLVALLWPTTDTWPPEIDFTEDNGVSPRTVDTATEHWGTAANPSQVNDTLAVNLSQWHTVGVEWTPGKIVYTMDGVPWATEANSNVSDVPMQLAVQTQAWQCNSAGTGWETCVDGTTPAEVDMDVDWIAVYAPASSQPASLDHLATVPAETPESPSVPLLAFASLVSMGGGLFLISKRSNRRTRQ